MNYIERLRSTSAIMLFGVMLPAISSGAGAVPVIPLQGKSVSLFSHGKETIYFLLTKSVPLKIQVDGPAKVAVLTRLSMPAEANGTEQYSIRVTEGKSILKEYITSTAKSTSAFDGGQYVPGKARKFSLAVPDGTHTYEFSLINTNLPQAVLRFSSKARPQPKLKGKTVRLEPLSYDRVATVVVAEKLITYYVCSDKKSVQLRVVGPSQLEIDTRLNYDAKMKGVQSYALSAWEGVKKISRGTFKATKALGAEYRDWKEVIPGKINIMSMAVPSGEHIIRFTLEETNAHSVSLKFSIPEPNLKN